MSSIAEALVATAIGLAVAIPAVAAYNYFQRLIKSTVTNTDALTRVLLAHLKGLDEDTALAQAEATAPKSGRGTAPKSDAKPEKSDKAKDMDREKPAAKNSAADEVA
jgi:biopolymer transport protein ExbB